MNNGPFFFMIIIGTIIGTTGLVLFIVKLLFILTFDKKKIIAFCKKNNLIRKKSIWKHIYTGKYKDNQVKIYFRTACSLGYNTIEISIRNNKYRALKNNNIYVKKWHNHPIYTYIICEIRKGLNPFYRGALDKNNYKDFHELLNILPVGFFNELFLFQPKVAGYVIIIYKDSIELFLACSKKGFEEENINISYKLIETLL